MRYLELYNEYTSLLKRQSEARRQLQSIPRGNITVKRISGKEYHYLQYTHLGKKKCQYLRETEVDSIREALTLRETLCQEIEETSFALDRLERAVKILDETMSRMFWFLRQCADMDALPISKRSKALSFARAITALEGLPAQDKTEENLKLWAQGNISFADFYLPALQNYQVMEEY